MCEQQAQAAAPQEEQRQFLQQMVSRIMDVGPVPSCPYKLGPPQAGTSKALAPEPAE